MASRRYTKAGAAILIAGLALYPARFLVEEIAYLYARFNPSPHAGDHVPQWKEAPAQLPPMDTVSTTVAKHQDPQ